MLYEFLIGYRDEIIARTQARVAVRTCPKAGDVELAKGIPIFFAQLTEAMHNRGTPQETSEHQEITSTAGTHGKARLKMGLTVAQVVHDYGDLCQSITELAEDHHAPIEPGEFQMLNLCLDEAIAGAVTEYAREREHEVEAVGTERLGILAHEIRNVLNVAMLSFDSIRAGQVAAGGSTGHMHHRALNRLRDLVDRSLAEVRLEAGIEHLERMSAAQLVEEVEIGAIIQAKARGLEFEASAVDPIVVIEGDRQTLGAALTNLLQNAFKFTKKGGRVCLRTRATRDRVLFEIEDECGGLPPGKIDELFVPFSQRGSDRTGVGLGLNISLRSAKANGGELHARDLPGKGCIFTLELPRKLPASVTRAPADTPEPHGHGARHRMRRAG